MPSDQELTAYSIKNSTLSNIIPFPKILTNFTPKIQQETILTPIYDKLFTDKRQLDKLSKYSCEFNYDVYKNLEIKSLKNKTTQNISFKLANPHNSFSPYKKMRSTSYEPWNNPTPVDLNKIRKIFYTVFETNQKSIWRGFLEQRIPFKFGFISDEFTWIEKKLKISQELLKVLNFYNYPYTILTRSDLLAQDDYLALLRSDLASVQYSLASTNEKMNKLIEPGTPSAKRRLKAVKIITDAGIVTTVRINPIFPIYPDGYFSNPNFKWNGSVPKFDYSSFDIVNEISETETKSIILNFGQFSAFTLNNIEKTTGYDLKSFLKESNTYQTKKTWSLSDKEIKYYYTEYQKRSNKIQFETKSF